MKTEESKQLPPPKSIIDLRVELKFKPLKRSRIKPKGASLTVVQGIVYQAHLVVTNLSNKTFKGASVQNVKFEFLGHNVHQTVNHDIQIPAINPKGTAKVEVTACSFNLDGGGWLGVDLVSDADDQEVQTYQYDLALKQDEVYDTKNKWGTSFYIEGKLATLQSKTNNYILVLTAMTVLEAVFGIKAILVFLLAQLAEFFGGISKFFSWLGSLT
ncbi:hypothetical protein L4C42_04130 [Vibrio wakamikoensis]|uniref:hypothetical protein n=1 Tax=Vibrio wakamikoensis TaxID=2910251 RepID=UPI003D1F62F5